MLLMGCADDQSTTNPDTEVGTQVDVTTMSDVGAVDTMSASDSMRVEAGDTRASAPDADPSAADIALPEDIPERAEDDVIASSDAGAEDTGAEPADADEKTDDIAGPVESSLVVGPALEDCAVVGLLAPNIPSEAGHYAAKVLTPTSYPFAIDGIRYSLLTNNEVITCSGAPAHQVLLFAIDAGASLPATPSASGLGYRQYDVPADPSAAGGRNVDLEVPIPLILTEGQSAVVAIQLATDGPAHICVADCQSAMPAAGTDWWSNAATPPFAWQDLVVDFSLTTNMPVQITGSSSF